MLWIIQVELSNYSSNPFGDTTGNEDFLTYNNLNEGVSDLRMAIIVVYFSMTSLSTVGFGDFNPRSDGERLVCSMALLFGVAIFSYFMGHIIEILDQNLKCSKEIGDDDSLAKFFGCMKRFNNGKRIPQGL